MKQLFRYLRENWWQVALLCLLCSISAFASVIQALATRNFVDYAVAGVRDRFVLWIALFFGLISLQIILNSLANILNESTYRLLAQEMLPESVEQVLYLDVDMIVMGSLEEFYNQDFDGKLLVACNRHGPGAVGAERLAQLTLPPDTTYFNAGTLLYDLAGQRREIDPSILYEYPVLFYQQLKYGDQDVLNAVFYGLTKFADYRVYNCFDYDITRQRQVEQVRRSCKVFHYNGKGKPWTEMYWGRMAWLFWEYAELLPEYAGQYEAMKEKHALYKRKRSAAKAKATRQQNRRKAEQENRKEETHEN